MSSDQEYADWMGRKKTDRTDRFVWKPDNIQPVKVEEPSVNSNADQGNPPLKTK